MRAPFHHFWLGLFLVLVGTISPSGGAAALNQPDPRGILLLVSQTGNLAKYGTGVVVAPNTILTADHILADRIQVLLSKAPVTAESTCRTRLEGLAVVRATLPKGTPQYRLSFRTPSVGETVTIAGYPLRKWHVATGRITSIIRSANLSGRVVNSPMIVYEPAMDYGASGSPVLDARGQVIAITVASNQESNYSVAVPTTTGLSSCRKFVR